MREVVASGRVPCTLPWEASPAEVDGVLVSFTFVKDGAAAHESGAVCNMTKQDAKYCFIC